MGTQGTGSYGVGLASYLRRRGHRIVEVNRGDRRMRRANGKSDTLDDDAYSKGIQVSDQQLAAVQLTGDAFHPEWNHTINPSAIHA